MRIVVIDSSSNSMLDIDYLAAKDSGVGGVILHAGYGKEPSQIDAAFRPAYEKAIEAGLLVGAYWMNYFRTVEDAKTEAEVFDQAIDGCNLQLGVYSDYEEDTIDYMDRSGGSKEDMTSKLIAFMDRMIDLGHAKSRFYTNTNCLNGAHGADALDIERLKPYGFWHAHYDGDENTEETEYNGLTVVGHQFANNDMKPDWIQGCPNIDVSIFNLDDIEEIQPIPTQDEEPQQEDESEPIIEPQEHTQGLIEQVQSFLNSYFGFGLDEDNICGPLTKDALIKAYQIEMNNTYNTSLEVDGIFGHQSKNAANNLLSAGDTNDVVKVLQASLQVHGYDMQGIDGIFGDITNNAVLDFQSCHGLEADGLVGQNTWTELFN